MAITRKEVEYVARLARLELSEEEAEKYTEQLDEIIIFIQKLNELDTTDVQPTSHTNVTGTVFREDRARQSDVLELALENAPEREGTAIRVPKVIT
jgi:aspartyl-tRNA(Asn)/glutamyl-tRNA(Gln) amidotransferase subunit C